MLYIGLIFFTPLIMLVLYGLFLVWIIEKPEKKEPKTRLLTYRELNAMAKYCEKTPP